MELEIAATGHFLSGPCAGTILQPKLHVVVPFSGGPVSGFAKRGTDGAVWSWGTFLQIYSEARGRREHQLSRFLTVFQPETGPRKGRPNRRKSTCALRAMQSCRSCYGAASGSGESRRGEAHLWCSSRAADWLGGVPTAKHMGLLKNSPRLGTCASKQTA